MDKGFSISGYLLSRLQPDDPREACLRMLCVTISKDMPEERRERQLRPFASDMEFMNMIAGWMLPVGHPVAGVKGGNRLLKSLCP